MLAGLPDDLLESACALRPAAPFHIAAGRPLSEFADRPTWADRYFGDLPEFVTLFTGCDAHGAYGDLTRLILPEFVTLFTGCDGYHWGYFFDAPGELEPVVAAYWHSDTWQHSSPGDTLPAALRRRVEHDEVEFLEMIDDDPDEEEHYRDRLAELVIVRDVLRPVFGADRPEAGEDYLAAYPAGRTRRPTAVTRSDMGVVVPKRQFRRLKSPDVFRPKGHGVEVVPANLGSAAAEAFDLIRQGFPGAALQLGHDLWVWGEEHPVCYELLDAAYAKLGREPLRKLLADARALRAHWRA